MYCIDGLVQELNKSIANTLVTAVLHQAIDILSGSTGCVTASAGDEINRVTNAIQS